MPKKIVVRVVYKNGSLAPLGYVDIEEGTIGKAIYKEKGIIYLSGGAD